MRTDKRDYPRGDSNAHHKSMPQTIRGAILLVVAFVLLFAAAAKIYDDSAFVATLYSLDLRQPIVTIVRIAAPWMEFTIAMIFILDAFTSFGLLFAACSHTIYALAIVARLSRGTEDINCGCFGGFLVLNPFYDIGLNFLIVCAMVVVLLETHARTKGTPTGGNDAKPQ